MTMKHHHCPGSIAPSLTRRGFLQQASAGFGCWRSMGHSTALRRRIDDPGIAHRELRTLSAHPSRGVGFTRLPVAEQVGGQDDNQKKDLGKVTLPLHLRLIQTGGQTQVFASANGRDWGEPRLSDAATSTVKAGSVSSSARAIPSRPPPPPLIPSNLPDEIHLRQPLHEIQNPIQSAVLPSRISPSTRRTTTRWQISTSPCSSGWASMPIDSPPAQGR